MTFFPSESHGEARCGAVDVVHVRTSAGRMKTGRASCSISSGNQSHMARHSHFLSRTREICLTRRRETNLKVCALGDPLRRSAGRAGGPRSSRWRSKTFIRTTAWICSGGKGGRRDNPAIHPSAARRIRADLPSAGNTEDLNGTMFTRLVAIAKARNLVATRTPTPSTACSAITQEQ